MTPDRRYNLLLRRWMMLLPVAAVVVGGGIVYMVYALPVPSLGKADARTAAPLAAAVMLPDALDWNIFRNEQAPTPSARGELARRFRLAGTFFAYGNVEGDTRKAVLHDLRESVQMIVGEGDRIGDVEVVRIVSDRVILRQGSEEAELWLGFSRADHAGGADDQATADADTDADGASAFGGRQTGEHSWVFRRDALQDYYQQVLDDPERLVRIFDSMKDVRGGDRRITGYRLDILGEGDFYRAVGMRQGDVVRKVNGMKMTSRRRAEFFIGEFARNRANVFEIEIERNGNPMKLTYQIR